MESDRDREGERERKRKKIKRGEEGKWMSEKERGGCILKKIAINLQDLFPT